MEGRQGVENQGWWGGGGEGEVKFVRKEKRWLHWKHQRLPNITNQMMVAKLEPF